MKKLAAKINPCYVKTRQGGAGQVLSYVAGYQMEMIANDIFDHQWSKETVYVTELYKREYKNKKGFDMVEVAYTCKVKVTAEIEDKLITKEGIGFGNGQASINMPSQAYELALKEAETDAMKRALKSFGTAFGLELWDKDADIKKSYEDGVKFDQYFHETILEMESCTEKEQIGEIYKKYTGNYKNELAKKSVEIKRRLK